MNMIFGKFAVDTDSDLHDGRGLLFGIDGSSSNSVYPVRQLYSDTAGLIIRAVAAADKAILKTAGHNGWSQVWRMSLAVNEHGRNHDTAALVDITHAAEAL